MRIVRELDVLLLRQQGARHPHWRLTPPLRPHARVGLAYGASLAGADLIGRRLLDTVDDGAGRRVTLHAPSLASYVLNSPRLATPIYPHDAAAIVSLLDLHPTRPGEDDGGEDDGDALEVFEAGTGMGSLTLHLARAVHAANAPVSPRLRRALCDATLAAPLAAAEDQAALDAYRAARRAVVHSLDCNAAHLAAAHRLVRNFRRAQYLGAVDFHGGSVADFFAARPPGAPRLAAAVLDMAAAHEHAGPVAAALRPDGLLVVFQPSVSQVAEVQAWAARTAQPLRLERVIELPTTATTDGVHDGAGGRLWDVRVAAPRAGGPPAQVMRPKVGDRVAGGGFVAVLRRWPAPAAH